jgi:tRNA1(Val) A37 N6-methylase TrmN6
VSDDPLTDDALLNGRVRFKQPAAGYRVAIDPVLLAAAVPAAAGERVLDVGAGTGAASLCLATRVPDCRIVGLELQRDLQRIASLNVAQNELGRRVEIIWGDLTRPPPRLSAASFEHVMTNPPHLAADSASSPPDRQRALAHVETGLDLAQWLASCVAMLRPGGCLTLIHRADRLADILSALAGRVGDLRIHPLWPGQGGKPAKRIIVQARRGARGPLALMPGLVLHQPDGRYTPAADAVLRAAAALPLADLPAAGQQVAHA